MTFLEFFLKVPLTMLLGTFFFKSQNDEFLPKKSLGRPCPPRRKENNNNNHRRKRNKKLKRKNEKRNAKEKKERKNKEL